MYEKYVAEIRSAEKEIERYARYYHAREEECPDSFKLLMMMNGWQNPFVALNELLKVIYTNEMLLRKNGIRKGYKSRYRKMERLVQENANKGVDPLFLAKDAAGMIEHSDASTMLRTVDDDENLIQTLFVSGQHTKSFEKG